MKDILMIRAYKHKGVLVVKLINNNSFHFISLKLPSIYIQHADNNIVTITMTNVTKRNHEFKRETITLLT